MSKRVLLIFICMFSCVCISPCYSMFSCCWGEDDEEDKTRLLNQPSSQRNINTNNEDQGVDSQAIRRQRLEEARRK